MSLALPQIPLNIQRVARNKIRAAFRQPLSYSYRHCLDQIFRGLFTSNPTTKAMIAMPVNVIANV